MSITQNGSLKRDDNDNPVMGGTSSSDNATIINAAFDPVTRRLLVNSSGGGSGTVTSVSVVSANGFAGTVATATTTPAITISTTINAPVLAGNGTAIAAATVTGTGSTVVLGTAPSISGATITTSTVNGVTLTTGGGTTTFLNANGAYSTPSGAAGITIGTTTITSGITTRILYDNAGVLGEYTITGTGTVVAMQTSPSFTTPAIGAATGTSLILTNTSATGFAVGANGSTNPVLDVDSSVASQADGIVIQGGAAGSGTTITATSSGANSPLTISSIGSGGMNVNSTSSSGLVNLQISSGTKVSISSTTVTVTDAQLIYNMNAFSSSSTRFLVTGASDTALPAATEALSVYYNLGQTRQFASNTTVALQRTIRVTGPTFAFATSGGTITRAATVSIDGAPSAGTNATITTSVGLDIPTIAVTGTVTNAYGLNVASPTGASGTNAAALFTGGVFISGALGSLAAFGPSGQTNPTFRVDSSTGSAATGLLVKSAAAAGGLALSTLSSGTNENLTIDAKGSGTINLGSVSSGAVQVNSVPIATTTGTQTLTNKRATRRLIATTQSATPAINTDNTDISNITGIAQAITSMTSSLTGTPVDGDLLEIRFTDNGTARAITWGASFGSTTVTLPSTTVISTMLRVLCEWNATASLWQCIAVA